MFCIENSRQKLPKTRSGIYKALHQFIVEKASNEMGHPREMIEASIIAPLRELAFKMLVKDSYVISGDDFNDLNLSPNDALQVGYIVREVCAGPLQQNDAYKFVHQSFLEFLAAMHIQTMDSDERQRFLLSMNVLHHRSLVLFMFGVMTGWALGKMVKVMLKRSTSRYTVFTSCAQGHTILQGIGECCITSDLDEPIATYIYENNQSLFLTPECSSMCIEGLKRICNLMHLPPQSLELTVSGSITTDLSPLKNIFESGAIEKVCFLEYADLRVLRLHLSWLQSSQLDSRSGVIRIRINSPKFSENPGKNSLHMGTGMEQMVLSDCRNVEFLIAFLKAVSKNRNLLSLSIEKSQLNGKCMSLLKEILGTLDLEQIDISGSTNAAPLLPLLEKCSKISDLGISLERDLDKTEAKSLERLLKKNVLSDLVLDGSTLSPRLCQTLQSQTKSKCMSALSVLAFRDIKGIDQTAFALFLAAADCLHLREVSFASFEISDENVILLSRVLPMWKAEGKASLYSLNICRLKFVLDGSDSDFCKSVSSKLRDSKQLLEAFQRSLPSSTKKSSTPSLKGAALRMRLLLCSITRCAALEELGLDAMGISDDSMEYICRAICALEKLKLLELMENKLSADALFELSRCLQQRELLKLSISGNRGCQVAEAVKNLQKFCKSVHY
jgi:hypothetical protein